MTKARVAAIFKSFDVDDNNSIDALNIKNAFTKLGKSVTDDEIRVIMQQHDTDKDGVISLAEFESMLLGCNIKEEDTAEK